MGKISHAMIWTNSGPSDQRSFLAPREHHFSTFSKPSCSEDHRSLAERSLHRPTTLHQHLTTLRHRPITPRHHPTTLNQNLTALRPPTAWHHPTKKCQPTKSPPGLSTVLLVTFAGSPYRIFTVKSALSVTKMETSFWNSKLNFNSNMLWWCRPGGHFMVYSLPTHAKSFSIWVCPKTQNRRWRVCSHFWQTEGFFEWTNSKKFVPQICRKISPKIKKA